jgi:hypothetical protein
VRGRQHPAVPRQVSARRRSSRPGTAPPASPRSPRGRAGSRRCRRPTAGGTSG